MPKLKDALRNEYVKSLIFLAIVLGSIVVFWFGVKAYLRTEYPMLAVASGSMAPTLNVGDLIIVQGGLNASDIFAAYGTGDIIVFRSPHGTGELIVHRAVAKYENSGTWYFTTKGDNNPGTDNWNGGVSESEVVGKVVGAIPYVGHIPLFIHTPSGIIIIVILLVILVLLEFAIPFVKERRAQEESSEESDILDVESL